MSDLTSKIYHIVYQDHKMIFCGVFDTSYEDAVSLKKYCIHETFYTVDEASERIKDLPLCPYWSDELNKSSSARRMHLVMYSDVIIEDENFFNFFKHTSHNYIYDELRKIIDIDSREDSINSLLK